MLIAKPTVCLGDPAKDHVIVLKAGKVVTFITRRSDKSGKFSISEHVDGYASFWFSYNSTNIPVDEVAADFLSFGKEVEKAAREVLEQLAKGRKPKAMDWDTAKSWSSKYHFTDTLGEPVRTVAGVPLQPTVQENDMATAKKAAPKKAVAKKEASAKDKKVAAAPKDKATAAPKAEKKESTGRKPGVGSLIQEGILAGHDNEKILAAIAKQFPESKSGVKDISWHKSKMRRDGTLK